MLPLRPSGLGKAIQITATHGTLTLRKFSAQLPPTVGFNEYVPLSFKGTLVAPDGTEVGGNVNVATALAPAARLVIAAGAESSDPEPSFAEVTRIELTVTLPVFVIVT